MKIKLQLIRKMQFGFGSAMAILLVVGVVSYRSVLASRDSDRWVGHTHDMLENLGGLLAGVQDVQASYRSFALMGDERFLEPYRLGVLHVGQEQKTIRSLTSDNPNQRRRLATLEGLTQQEIQFGDGVILDRQTKSEAAALQQIRLADGTGIMEKIRVVVRDMKDEEHTLLLQRDAEAERRSRQTKAVLILGSTLGLLIAALAGWVVKRDYVARVCAEQLSKEAGAKYRGLLEAAPDAIVVVDKGGEIVLLNVQAEKQFGYRRDELLRQKVKNIIPEGFAERLIADGTRSAAEALAQQIGTGIELSGRRKDGSEFPIEIMLSPLENAAGILVTAAIRDITTRKAADKHLLQKIAELKRSNEELAQFAYVASHDLQEPLRMVASYTQLLAKRYKGRLDADADEFIAFAVDGSNRMQGLIQDLLAYSRAGNNERSIGQISSENALREALVNLRARTDESGALVTHDVLPKINMDHSQLVQLFQNLIGNAIKYRSAKVPTAHVSAKKGIGGEWIFSVRDNGMGIDPRHFERIFVIFQRLHGREEFAGTGIGLAICKKIVQRDGGRIWVESEPDKGSTFYFAMPEGKAPDGNMGREHHAN